MEKRNFLNVFKITLLTLYMTRQVWASGQGDCVCEAYSYPVCANNYFTYENPCQFECAKKLQPRLLILWNGHCDNPPSWSSSSGITDSNSYSDESSGEYMSMTESEWNMHKIEYLQ